MTVQHEAIEHISYPDIKCQLFPSGAKKNVTSVFENTVKKW